MIDVVIPPDRLSDVQSEACARWLVEHTKGSAIGHGDGSHFLIRFDEQADAEAFSQVWIDLSNRKDPQRAS
jgi:hypothetical protein